MGSMINHSESKMFCLGTVDECPTPVWMDQQPLMKEKLDALHELAQQQLTEGHEEPSVNPWNTPVFVIKRKHIDGECYTISIKLMQSFNLQECYSQLCPLQL